MRPEPGADCRDGEEMRQRCRRNRVWGIERTRTMPRAWVWLSLSSPSPHGEPKRSRVAESLGKTMGLVITW